MKNRRIFQIILNKKTIKFGGKKKLNTFALPYGKREGEKTGKKIFERWKQQKRERKFSTGNLSEK